MRQVAVTLLNSKCPDEMCPRVRACFGIFYGKKNKAWFKKNGK